MIPQYNVHPQSQYMQHPQYMQKMPNFNDNMGTSNMFAGSNVNQMPPNRLPQQQSLQQQPQHQQQLHQSHPQQPMIDTKYSNHYPFVGNTNLFYQGGNTSNNGSNNNINKKN